MFHLRDLLGQAVKRARVSTQVSATQIVSLADEFLTNVMSTRKRDVRVVSFHDGVLTIETLHSSASQFIFEQEKELRRTLQERHPELPVRMIRTRVVHRFRKSEL